MPTRALAHRLALLLVLAAAPVTLAGCGGGDGDEAGDSALAEDVAADEEAASEEPAPEPEPAAAPDTSDYVNQRPTQVAITVTGDRTWAGTYRASDKSRVCGPMSLGLPGRENNFHVGYPYENADQVSDVTFNADTLPVGGTTTSFHLSVALRSPGIGAPPNLVFRTNDPKSGETGTASLVQRGDTAVLQVSAKDERSALTMTVRCARRER